MAIISKGGYRPTSPPQNPVPPSRRIPRVPRPSQAPPPPPVEERLDELDAIEDSVDVVMAPTVLSKDSAPFSPSKDKKSVPPPAPLKRDRFGNGPKGENG